MDKDRLQYLMENNYSCSQAVLCYFADKYGIDEDKAKNLVSGMDCGMSQAKTCTLGWDNIILFSFRS